MSPKACRWFLGSGRMRAALRWFCAGLLAAMLSLVPPQATHAGATVQAPAGAREAANQPSTAAGTPMRLLHEPLTCVMGVYLQDMRDYKFADRSLFASIRLWSVCPSADDSPLKDLNVLNANGVTISDINTQKMANESGYFPNSPMVYWSERTVEGTFFHHWSAKNFPFDRHTIVFEFESVREIGRAHV